MAFYSADTEMLISGWNTLYKATIILMVRGNFKRTEFLFDLDDIRNPVQIDPSRALNRILVLDFDLHDFFPRPDERTKESPFMNAPGKHEPTPTPSWFDISLAAYIQVTGGACPLGGHDEEEEVSNEEDSNSNSANPFLFIFRWAFVNCWWMV
jgi:hypothetical protein